MSSEDASHTQAKGDLNQGLARLDVCQTLSIKNVPPPSFPHPSLPTTLPAQPQGPPTPRATFLGLPREVRDMIYAQIFSVDQNPLLHPTAEGRSKLDTGILQTNGQVRDEAYEILRDNNIWIIVVINTPSDYPVATFVSRLLLFPASHFKPIEADWLGFHDRKSIVIELGGGCGARNARTSPAGYHSEKHLFAYDRQSFAYLCLKLWECTDRCLVMTVIWNIPSSWTDSSRLLDHVKSSLLTVRGFRTVVCIGFPGRSLKRRLEGRMTMQIRVPHDVFKTFRHYCDGAQTAFDAGRNGQAVHMYRCARWATQCLNCAIRKWPSVPANFANACARIDVDIKTNCSKALCTFFSDVQNVSMERFWKLSDHLIDHGVIQADLAMNWPGITDLQRMKAHQSRGNAFRFRAEYYSRNGEGIEGKEAQIRSDHENAALDLYYASKLVYPGIHPQQPPVEPALSQIEERHLKCTRADTIARVDFRSLRQYEYGTVWEGDGRFLGKWNLTEEEFCVKMLLWRRMPPADQAMHLI
jgi:hypothetical protein